MNNWNKICGFATIFLFFCAFSFGQIIQKESSKDLFSYPGKYLPVFHVNTIAPNYYTKNMGFFCKKELVVEKSLKIPLRFRLGALSYCNYLEGKKN